jgi:DNA ligase-1
MNRFASLYRELDETTKTSKKSAAMREYFAACGPADGAWAVFFLSGRRFKRLIPVARLRDWCAAECAMPGWLFDECYGATGDLAETMALVMPQSERRSSGTLTEWIEHRIQPLASLPDADQRQALVAAWSELSTHERLVFNKLVTGEFRVGVAQQMVIRALSDLSGETPQVIAHRLMGSWEPTPEFFQFLVGPDSGESDHSRPFPFCLAHPFASELEELGDIQDWLIEWKWDGIRGQILRRNGQSFVWSRGEESMLERFPELSGPIQRLPNGTVLDGEIVAWNANGILPFAEMQRRIGRKTIGKKLLSEVPVRFLAFDLLEENGVDIRSLPFSERRRRLEATLQNQATDSSIMLSPLISAHSWLDLVALRESSRERHVEGMMLKRANSEYGTGRVTGLWWKWKIEPYTCDAVLIYAQRGHGRRASLYTDYTFGVWDQGQLVPFAKAYSGLTDQEIREVDRYVRQHTLEKFGPVRAVVPDLVFELAFEDIQFSKRHKSGIAVRFPRIARWRHDKRPEQADSMETLQRLLELKSPRVHEQPAPNTLFD